MGEILGAVILAKGFEHEDVRIVVNEDQGNFVKVLECLSDGLL